MTSQSHRKWKPREATMASQSQHDMAPTITYSDVYWRQHLALG